MTAAPGVIASQTLPASAWAAEAVDDSSAYPGVALPTAARLRASVIGLGLGALALAAATLGALAIVTGPLHTSLGGIA